MWVQEQEAEGATVCVLMLSAVLVCYVLHAHSDAGPHNTTLWASLL